MNVIDERKTQKKKKNKKKEQEGQKLQQKGER